MVREGDGSSIGHQRHTQENPCHLGCVETGLINAVLPIRRAAMQVGNGYHQNALRILAYKSRRMEIVAVGIFGSGLKAGASHAGGAQ